MAAGIGGGGGDGGGITGFCRPDGLDAAEAGCWGAEGAAGAEPPGGGIGCRPRRSGLPVTGQRTSWTSCGSPQCPHRRNRWLTEDRREDT
jgi:hypothetical protein